MLEFHYIVKVVSPLLLLLVVISQVNNRLFKFCFGVHTWQCLGLTSGSLFSLDLVVPGIKLDVLHARAVPSPLHSPLLQGYLLTAHTFH